MKTNLLLWAAVLCFTVTHAQSTLDFGPDASACMGDITALDASHLNADSYLWQDGSTEPIFYVIETGTYWLVAVKGTQTYTDTIDITVNPLPQVNLGQDDHFFCPPEVAHLEVPPGIITYNWIISKPSGNTVLIDQTSIDVEAELGSISITLNVTDLNGCGNFDQLWLSWVIDGVDEPNNRTSWLDAYPNPTSDQLTLRMKKDASEQVELTILDLQGRPVKQEVWPNGWQNGQELRVDVIDLPSGSYLLQLSGSSIQINHNFLKMN